MYVVRTTSSVRCMYYVVVRKYYIRRPKSYVVLRRTYVRTSSIVFVVVFLVVVVDRRTYVVRSHVRTSSYVVRTS